jgi:hypothetical protein
MVESVSMAVRDLFSRRKKLAQKGTEPDVYQYEDIPRTLRTQITFIWLDSIGPYFETDGYGFSPEAPNNSRIWDQIHNEFAREKGLGTLGRNRNTAKNCIDYLQSAQNIDDILDIIDFTFQYVQLLGQAADYERKAVGIVQSAEDAIEELNFRLRDAGVGYQFEAGQLIRVDSQFLHAEVVRPALALMSASGFDGSFAEFTKAHAHYRTKEYKACVIEALKSFESVLKVICTQSRWKFSENSTASGLIKTVLDNGLVPGYLESSLQALQSVLVGLPTVRNREAGHGQGADVREVPEFLASYALHLAATNIVFLISAHLAGRSSR